MNGVRFTVIRLALALCAARALADPIPVRDGDTVVFLGDSITEQNLYTAMVETFLITRLPDRRLAFHNRGWSGDTAWGGDGRFARDVATLKPSLVFVDFGMNDGAYMKYEPWITDNFVQPQREIARQIKAAGAREVLLAQTPVDYHAGAGWYARYNDTLERLAWSVTGLGAELGLPVVDLFHPVRDVVTRAKRTHPKLDLIPDSIHPGPAGHLLMARAIIAGLDVPRGVGTVRIAGRALAAAEGLSVSAFAASADGLMFAMTPPCIPFFVPKSARAALDLVPFEDELNRFRLVVADWPQAKPCRLIVDGAVCATFYADALAAGVDLALVDKAPWAGAGWTIWEEAQLRFHHEFEAWRTLDTEADDPELLARPAARALKDADLNFAEELARRMRELARPRTYRIALR